MTALPWSKFFWADWRSDPGLRSCSAHARGIWMDCLCLAAEADPTGYVLVNGRTPTTTDLARLTGEPEAAVQSALEELERNGVFSRDRHDRIYNRRMVRDIRRIAKNRKNGKLGGNPKLLVENEDLVSLNHADNQPDKAKKPDARSLEEAGSETEPINPENESAKTAHAPLYAFVGKVIRLVPKDFDAWRTTYHGIPDLTAELATLDAFYDGTLTGDDRKKWFIRCASALDKKHQHHMAERIKAEAWAARPITERYPNEGVFR